MHAVFLGEHPLAHSQMPIIQSLLLLYHGYFLDQSRFHIRLTIGQSKKDLSLPLVDNYRNTSRTPTTDRQPVSRSVSQSVSHSTMTAGAPLLSLSPDTVTSRTPAFTAHGLRRRLTLQRARHRRASFPRLFVRAGRCGRSCKLGSMVSASRDRGDRITWMTGYSSSPMSRSSAFSGRK